jgi:hypothetical protein
MDTLDETPPLNDDAPNDAPPPGWTLEQWAAFQEYTRGYGDQDENGIDLSLLRENLKLTPTERWAKHQRALALAMEVSRAGEAARLRQRVGRS